MLQGLLTLLACQLAGEALAHAAGLPIPGPVIGLALLALLLLRWPRLEATTAPVATTLLANLSLLFIPAAVGVVQVLPLLADQGLAIAAAILASTLASLLVTALTFRAVLRRRPD